uniref:Peptidase A1 domain-containing protein n=1 Tax=Leersia perrieri TaxID=77586 RepID=A0A0D9V3H5_9ORYZ
MDSSILSDNPAPQFYDSSATLRFTLLHREHPCLPTSTVPADHFSSSTLSRHRTRVRRLATGCFSSCPVDEGNMSGSIFANGVPWDQYSYVTQIQLGTPATTYNVLVDTGSSLSWIRCKPCTNECPGSVFDPAASSTYNAVYCRSSLCNAVPSATMAPINCWLSLEKCSYKQTYEDGSTSVGVVSSDQLIHGGGNVQELVFGCSNRFEGLGGHYSGIIGISANTLSFFTQLTVGRRYRATSYCFPHPSKKGFL